MTTPEWWDHASRTLPALAIQGWQCAAVEPGADWSAVQSSAEWLPAQVPGTACAAVRAVGKDAPRSAVVAAADPDDWDWWFRARLPPGCPSPSLLRIDGLATLADVWVEDQHVLRSENMFVRHELEVTPAPESWVIIRCGSLTPTLAQRRPRPPWRTRIIRHAGLRWIRTTALGRMPSLAPDAAPVGPWREVSVVPVPMVRVHRRSLAVTGAPDAWRLAVEVELVAGEQGNEDGWPAKLRLAGTDGALLLDAPVQLDPTPLGFHVQAELPIGGAATWWPAGYGEQPRYEATLAVHGAHSADETVLPLGGVGFRAIGVDTSDGGFELRVNNVPVFARGAVWDPLDRVSLTEEPSRLRAAVARLAAAGATMLRVPGTAVYPSDELLDLCDEFGILLWQDLMVANLPPPDDGGLLMELDHEMEQLAGRLQGRPCLAIVSGGSEVEQQAAMFGLAPERQRSPVLHEHVPVLLAELLPGIPYVPSSPTGGDPPVRADVGVAHWFGVGGYLMPLESVRLAGVRFAAECLALSNLPEAATVETVPGGAAGAGHLPAWKAQVPRDNGASWDFEDVRDHYIRELFGIDPLIVRRTDPERALDLGRATNAHLVERTLAEWRRPGSRCAGALVLADHDQTPGAGWGLVDATGRPKSVWYAARRRWAPVAATITDEGLSGLDVHILNDRQGPLTGRLVVRLVGHLTSVVEESSREVVVPGQGSLTCGVEELLGGFRDVAHHYRFGPESYDAVEVVVLDAEDVEVSRDVHLTAGLGLPVRPDLGLAAEAVRDGDDGWSVQLRTDHLAESVVVDLPGFDVTDSWFHLLPGRTRTVRAVSHAAGAVPEGAVRALNCSAATSIVVLP